MWKTAIFWKTPKVVDAVTAQVWRNPKRFMMGMACDMNVSDMMMRNIVKTDLKLSSLKMQTCQCLTDHQKEQRLDRAKILLNKLKVCTDTDEIIFSDEKLFTVEAICNRQNDRVLAKSFADIPDSRRRVFICQKLLFVMVWAVISKTWKSLFFLEGAWCQDHFPCFWSKEIWLPSSPDLKVMDCCVQSLLEADACASLHGLVEAQKHSLMTEWAKMPQETLCKAAEGFRSRPKCVIQARGGHIE